VAYDWTPERVDRLRKDWADGYSCSQIGARMGITRNAVIGKVSRMGLPPRTTVFRSSGPGTPRRRISGPSKIARINARRKASGATPYSSLAEFEADLARANAERAAMIAAPDLVIPPSERKPILTRNAAGNLYANDALDAQSCRWTYGDGTKADPFYCCGKPKQSLGLPYCAFHNARAFRPPEPRRAHRFVERPRLVVVDGEAVA